MGFPQSPSGPLNIESIPKVVHTSENRDSNPDSYESWLIQHPSALNTFEQMMSEAEGKNLVLFLDYDGTLSSIVDDPEKAFMTDAMRRAVREVADCFPTAIVSGRAREKVMKFVELKNVYYAGSHGMDILTPLGSQKYGDKEHQTRTVDEKGNKEYHFHPAQKFLPAIQEIAKELNNKIKSVEGASIEDNKFCISLHHRRVNEKDVGTLKEMVKSIIEAHPGFHKTEGKMVMEIRPDIKWDKGHALDYLLDTLGFGDSPDVVPIYIGDDITDEDAFKVIKQRNAQGCCQGYPIVVSSITKKTNALYSLREPEEVMSFLLRLAKWKNSSSTNKLLA